MSVVTFWTRQHPGTSDWDYRSDSEGPTTYERAIWSPTPGHRREFRDVPEPIAQAAMEAWTCHMAGAERGAVALARAVVEATAKAKGFTEGRLVKKIKDLAEAGLIRPAVKDHADEIRYLGNDAAHGDLETPITADECEEILELMGEVLNEVWQAPARSERLAAKRRARSEPSAG